MSFEGIESFLMFRILDKDVKDLLPREKGLDRACLSWVRLGKEAASIIGVLCHSAPLAQMFLHFLEHYPSPFILSVSSGSEKGSASWGML